MKWNDFSKGWILLFIFFFSVFAFAQEAVSEELVISGDIQAKVKTEMISKFGKSHEERIDRSVTRVASLWWREDGLEEDFERFCLENFIVDQELLDKTFHKIEKNFESIWGYTHQIRRDLLEPIDLDLGELLPIDYLFAKTDLSLDYFQNKLAFFIVLNFPHYSLDEKLKLGPRWSRKEWAKVRVGDMFTSRIPNMVSKKLSDYRVESNSYVNDYNIYMDHLLTADRKQIFPEGLRLISFPGLRDELKELYADLEGLAKQEMIFNVMLRIIEQSIPKIVINSPEYYWDPESNKVFEQKSGRYLPVSFKPEENIRYQFLLKAFKNQRKVDAYSPQAASFIMRKFNDITQMPEGEVERLLESLLASPEVKSVASLIKKRLGRKLKPFDIWYIGFQTPMKWKGEELDRIVGEKYPNPQAFQEDIPNILVKIGFSKEKAEFLAEHIVVDPTRSGGHAMGARMRGDKAHLRTRFTKKGVMNFQGYRIAMHELGHNVEQNLSLYGIDYYFLRGVPDSAFTEGFAILFNNRFPDMLGLDYKGIHGKYLAPLHTFWYALEHAGVALTEMKIWRWMYAHPEATADQLKDAYITIAKNVWNQYYAPVFEIKDSPILGYYPHIIFNPLYFYNFPLGNIILFQFEDFIRGKNFGTEMERMCILGKLTPSLWMQKAVGSEVSSEPLLKATKEALRYIKE